MIPRGNREKKLIKCLLAGALLILLAGAISIPFVYESQTLWYKIGIDKTLLRVGKIAGLLTLISLLVQIVIAARGRVLEELFTVAALVRCHRLNGVAVLTLALFHVVLILVPEGIFNLPIGVKYWPEMVGELLVFVVATMVLSAQFRQKLGLAYGSWRTIHRSLGYLTFVLVLVHAFFVSESFGYTIPQTILTIVALSVFFRVASVKVDF